MTSSEGSESTVVSVLFWQFCIKQQCVIELCLVFQTDSQKLFISFLLLGKIISQGVCQSFLQYIYIFVFFLVKQRGWRKKMERGFRDATLETWNRQSHCLIRLSIQLTLLHHQDQSSNQLNMLAGGGQQSIGCSPHANISRTGAHMGYSAVVDFLFPCYNLPALCWATAPIYKSLSFCRRHLVNV